MKKVILITAIIFAGSISIQAQTNRAPKVNAKQEIQLRRIKQGVASGELTRAETKRLVKEQRIIQRVKRHAKRDGKLTGRERVGLNKLQNAASRDIKRQKNNDRRRN